MLKDNAGVVLIVDLAMAFPKKKLAASNVADSFYKDIAQDVTIVNLNTRKNKSVFQRNSNSITNKQGTSDIA